jgi:hypothetical protein
MKAYLRRAGSRLPVRGLLLASLASTTVACGGGSVSIAPNTPATSTATGIAALPSTSSFATSSTSSPAATTRATVVTLTLAPEGGYGGKATFELSAVPAGMRLAVRYASSPPPLVKPFSVERKAIGIAAHASDAISVRSAVAFSDSNDRAITYTTIASTKALPFVHPPTFTFSLPSGFALPSVNYYIALWTGTSWVEGYSVAAMVASTATVTTITATGSYAPAVAANGNLQIVLYARNASAGNPSPAPVPTAPPHPV